MASVATLHHAPRSGKTLVAIAAAQGWSDVDSSKHGWTLREHQREALMMLAARKVAVCKEDVSSSTVIWVCSSLIVAKQLLDEWIRKLDSIECKVVCSLDEDSFGGGEVVVTDESELRTLLRSKRERQLILVTSYHSVHKIHAALGDINTNNPSLIVLDEAHNVHTPTRWFLWGAKKRGDTEPNLNGIEALNSRYPKRLYLTGTPSDAMYKWPAVYGDENESWHRCSYSNLMKIQTRLNPYVKEFSLRIVVNGRPANTTESAEFFDCVTVLREAVGNPNIRRVKMYHRRAHRWTRRIDEDNDDKSSTEENPYEDDDDSAHSFCSEPQEEERRSVEFFAQADLWIRALDYLRSRGETTMPDEELVISQVRGDMHQKDIQDELAAFNSDCCHKLRVLCSCQVFREGVTLERCDLTVYADGKRSRRDIIQSSMRGLKAEKDHPDKQLQILLLVSLDGFDVQRSEAAAVVCDDGGCAQISRAIVETLRSRDKMETTAAVIEALKSEDDDLMNHIIAAVILQKRDAVKSTSGSSRSQDDHQEEDQSNKRQRRTEKIDNSRLSISVSPELLWTVGGADDLKSIQSAVANSVCIRLNALNAKQLVSLKVDWFCRLWANDTSPPKNGEKRQPKKEWLPAGKELAAASIDGGFFWNHISNNFIGDGSVIHTVLNEEDRSKVRSLPWFDEAIQRIKHTRERRAKHYQPRSTSKKVDWFCRLWADDTSPPKHGDKRQPKKEWLPPGEELVAAPIVGGTFWNDIRNNFVGDESVMHTVLNEEDRSKVRSLPWFDEAIQRIKHARERRAKHYQPRSTSKRVDWFCRLWADDTSPPKHGDKRQPKKEWLPPGEELVAAPIDGGTFWNHIRNIFVGDESVCTKLNEEDRSKVRSLPWFDEAMQKLKNYREKKVSSAAGKQHSSTPRC